MPPDGLVDSLIDEADEALAQGETEQALQRFEQVLAIEPEHWGASLGRIECLHLLWRTNEALRDVGALAPQGSEEDD
ncbi:MAG: tetratricopeptide repeat protein, partial [Candidatus Eiseniibacteriota bacterium]